MLLKKTVLFNRVIIVLLGSLANFVHGQFVVSKFLYHGYQNVWHNGTEFHEPHAVGDPSVDRTGVRNTCANLCSLDTECDAFYVEAKELGSCHLVDEDLTPDLPRTIGHGFRTEKMYYVKTPVSPSVSSINIPPELIPPCDLDEATLTVDQCNSLPTEHLTFYECPSSESAYIESVPLISDLKCADEDRLLQCELSGGLVGTNIINNREATFNRAFAKAAHEPLGMMASGGETLDNVIMTFKNPRKISRVILRSTRKDVEHLRKVELIIHGPGLVTEKISLEFTSTTQCAVHVNFEAYTNLTHHLNAERLEMKPISWFGSNPHGFKMDLFVMPPVV